MPTPDWDTIEGWCAVIPVMVDWPELRLTGDQILANSLARMDGYEEPFPNHSIFNVVVTRAK